MKRIAQVRIDKKLLAAASHQRELELVDMYIRRFITAVWLCAVPLCSATAGEPVVRGTFHTVLVLGQQCVTVPKTDVRLRPGVRLEMRPCQNRVDQIFEWNVVTFEIKFHRLCMDAFRVGDAPSQPGDPVGLWYCQKTQHQKWFPHHKNESWMDAFNIVAGGSPSSDLCLDIADGKSVDGARLTIQTCRGGDNQWFRLYPWPPPGNRLLSRRFDSIFPPLAVPTVERPKQHRNSDLANR